jgi:hypothetical protein
MGRDGRAGRGFLEESVRSASDTRQAVQFQLQVELRVAFARAVRDIAPPDGAQAPAAGTELDAGELLEA